MRDRMLQIASLCLLVLLPTPAEAALTFAFNPSASTPADVISGFQAAGDRWSALLSDDVNINVDIGFLALDPGVLGQASSLRGTIDYSGFQTALAADRLTADDFSSVANLQPGTNFKMLLNYTSNSPNGAGSPTPYLDNDGDANNSTIRMTLANARALGLWDASDATRDAEITFSSAYSWDFDPTNGITAGSFDFVGVAAHEIGHALGFISGVDVLDINSTDAFFADNAFTYVSPLDMFRFSADSLAMGAGVIDWTAGLPDVARYFSVDGGVTAVAPFSLGRVHGDGRQASHWKDSLGLGLMDPTAARGELLGISTNDLRAMDVIGWNLQSVPEPDSMVLLAGVSLVLLIVRRGRRV